LTSPEHPPGFLRLTVLFHETAVLGAGTAVLRCCAGLRSWGWTTCGWFPGTGPLLETAEPELAVQASAERPFAFSRRGFRESPGVLARLWRTPAYAVAVRRSLLSLRPHVVHANTLRVIPEAAVARSLGLPVVFHVHEIPPPGPKRAAAVRAAAAVADVLVAVSGAVAEMLLGHGIRTPVVVVPNGVAPGLSPTPLADGDCTVGTVATVSREKGTDIFLRAAALAAERRPQLRFEHVGQADLHHDTGLDVELESLRSAPPLTTALAMLGRRPAHEHLGSWGMFVLASRQDSAPLAVLEAMAAGLPVIATSVGGVPEQITHLETGVLVPPEDPGALAEWIVRLYDDPELRRRLGKAAAQRIGERFSLTAQVDGLHRAYSAAMVLRHGPPPARKRTKEALWASLP
jgi:glycosyltransferase involved in cell wall biosynthesis